MTEFRERLEQLGADTYARAPIMREPIPLMSGMERLMREIRCYLAFTDIARSS